MPEKESKRIPLNDWPEHLTTEHLKLSEAEENLLELFIKTRRDKKGEIPRTVLGKTMHNCTKDGISPIVGLFIILNDTDHEGSQELISNCFEKDSAGLIDLFKNGGAIQDHEEVFCTLILNSLRKEDLRIGSLKKVLGGEKASEVIHSILDEYVGIS